MLSAAGDHVSPPPPRGVGWEPERRDSKVAMEMNNVGKRVLSPVSILFPMKSLDFTFHLALALPLSLSFTRFYAVCKNMPKKPPSFICLVLFTDDLFTKRKSPQPASPAVPLMINVQSGASVVERRDEGVSTWPCTYKLVTAPDCAL